ncbi:hypothetical protein Tco_0032799 [Tanacetum coccineum]
MPHDLLLPGGHTLGSDEGNMTLHELTVLCEEGRMIEDIDQDAGISLFTPTKVSSQEDQSEDQLGVLSAAKVLAGVSTASRIFSTTKESVSTAGASMPVSTTGMVQQVNIIIHSSSETTETTKDKAQIQADKDLAQKLLEEESLVKERFNSTDPTDDKERTLWVELKRLFEPDTDDILWKLQRFTKVKTASTPIETQKPLLKDENSEEVDVHMYRLMIGSLMYLTSSRPDIMFEVCACARYQVNPKVSHLHVVKMIFRYLKGQPKLGLWYPKDSPFDLVAYTDSDYAGASLDRKSTTGGCQFLGSRLISWQCKKQTVVGNSTTKA